MSAPFNIQRLPFLDEELLNEHIDRLSRIPVGSHARSSLDLPDIPLPPLDPGSEEVSVTLVGGELPVTHIQDDYIPGGVRHVSMESQSFQANAFLRALELDDFRVLGSNHSSLSDFSDVNILGSDSDDEIDFSEYTDISRPAPQNPAGPGDIPPRSPSYPQDINQLVDLFLPLVDSVTEATQSLWTHRLFRHYLERWFPSDSELALIGHFCEPEQLPSAMVPALCHLARGPLLELLNWMVEGRYVEYCTIVKNCGLQKEVEIQLLDLGREFWEGKEDEVDIVHRFHKALITVSPDQTRILTRAGTNLFQRRRVASIERADENLRLIRDGFNIAFQLIKRDMDERARYEVDDMARLLRGQRQPVDTKKTAQKYKPGTLGYKLDRLINRIAKRVADHLSPEYFAQKLEEAVQRCEHDKETLCFIQRMLDNKEVFCGVAAHLGVLGLEVIHGFLTRTLESFLLTILAHDASDLLQDCVKALHQSMSIYYREKDKIGGYQYKHPLPLLKALHEQDGERYSLHPNVPVSTEKARIHRADQDYFVHHLIPKLKELVFPNSTLMDEIVSAFIQGDAGWEDAFGVKERPAGFVKAAFSGIDHTLSLIAGEFIIETMEEYLDPTKLNRMVVEWIEEQWQEELEDAEKDGDPKRLAFLRSKQMEYQRYLRANTGTEEQRTYVHATLAIRYAVALWAPNPYPGTHVLVQATLLQLLELIQSKPMIKNLIYHVLDKCFDHLLSEPKQAAADLNRPIESIRRRHGGDGPFKNTCMREMASLVLDMVRIGSNHLPAETSYAGWGTILIGRIVAWFSESRVIEMIREKLEDLWVNKFELSFPGLLALALDKLHSWIKDPEEGLEAMLKEGKTPKLKF